MSDQLFKAVNQIYSSAKDLYEKKNYEKFKNLLDIFEDCAKQEFLKQFSNYAKDSGKKIVFPKKYIIQDTDQFLKMYQDFKLDYVPVVPFEVISDEMVVTVVDTKTGSTQQFPLCMTYGEIMKDGIYNTFDKIHSDGFPGGIMISLYPMTVITCFACDVLNLYKQDLIYEDPTKEILYLFLPLCYEINNDGDVDQETKNRGIVEKYELVTRIIRAECVL